MKPENIFIREDGQVKIGDFGISRVLATSDGNTIKGDGGTLYYMPPEFFNKEVARFAGDIWAVGCIFHEIITG